MTIKADHFCTTVHFGKGSILEWDECSADDTEFLMKMVEEQGPPFRYGGCVINPEHVRYVNAYHPTVHCPTCTHYWSADKDCRNPDYH